MRCCFPVTSLVISADALLGVSAISVKLTTESSTASHTHHRKQHCKQCGQKQREERERAGNGISYIKMTSTVLSVQENKTRACDSANHYSLRCKSAANHYSLPWKAAHFAAVRASESTSAHGKKRAHFALRPAEGAAVGGGRPRRPPRAVAASPTSGSPYGMWSFWTVQEL